MNQEIHQTFPKNYDNIEQATRSSGFTMASDPLTGCLLRTLAASKSAGRLLELGTGTGLSTSWILDGMDKDSTLTSIDNEPAFLGIAQQFLGDDPRLQLLNKDGAEWFEQHKRERYDFIFADTWHGKYLLLDEALSMLNKGGLYIIDDMLPQPDWPDGHAEKAIKLVGYLEKREDLLLTKQVWSTGIIIAVKR
jgi:predicted O-methyltransferase YrrM